MPSTAGYLRTSLLGGAVDVVRRREVLEFIERAAGANQTVVVGNQNLHSLYLCRSNAELVRFYERADLIEIDSMPMVYWGRLLGLKTQRQHRSTYLDWRDAFWRMAQRNGWRVFLLGAAPGVAEDARGRLSALWPGLKIGVHHGFFDLSPGSEENAEAVRSVNAFRPHVTLVGMGMPHQEVWIARNIDALESGVTLSVGAAIDYEAGAQPPAPRILGDLCLEWLYRLVRDPRRLWRRYLLEPWALSGAAWRDIQAARRRADEAKGQPAARPAPADASVDRGEGDAEKPLSESLPRAA